MRLLLLLVASLTVASGVFADDFSLSGVWEGALGDKKIVACFNAATKGAGVSEIGSYYYLRHLYPIRLVKRDGQWLEEERYESNRRSPLWPNELANKPPSITGKWSIKSVNDRKLTGSWKSIDDKKILKLDLVMVEESVKACSSNSYNSKPEQVLPKNFVGKTETFNGKPFRRLQMAGYGTLELLDNNPYIAEINRHLRNGLPSNVNDESIKEFFKTRRYHLGEFGSDYKEVEEFDELTYWTSTFLTIKHNYQAPNEGRRGVSIIYTTWDLRTGKVIDLWTWFNKKSLMELLVKSDKSSLTCSGYYSEGQYNVTLESTGVRFWENADGDGCEKDFHVPYLKLIPVLTELGKSEINAIIKNQKK